MIAIWKVSWRNALVGVALLVPGVVIAAADPWEGANRRVFSLNDWADRTMLRPTAQAYVRFVPGRVRAGVSNVFENIGTPAVAVNQMLQGKPASSLEDLGRFLLNTTLGIGGMFDVASRFSLEKHHEDFGQTFGVWGVGSGNYVMLPLLGPSNVRDATGRVVDGMLNPLRFITPASARSAVTAGYVIDSRAALLGVDELVTGDRYLFLRDSYIQRRNFQIADGMPDEDPFADDGFEFEDG